MLDKTAKTRELVERSGRFVIQVPTAQLRLTHAVGSHSLAERPDKLREAGVTLFDVEGHDRRSSPAVRAGSRAS